LSLGDDQRSGHAEGVKRHLSASEVAQLAELLEDAPVRVGTVDEVLQAAAENRGMTLELREGTATTEHTGRRASVASRLNA
jgi:hypothetical protein